MLHKIMLFSWGSWHLIVYLIYISCDLYLTRFLPRLYSAAAVQPIKAQVYQHLNRWLNGIIYESYETTLNLSLSRRVLRGLRPKSRTGIRLSEVYSQRDTTAPNIHFDPRECFSAVCNFWWLEGRGALSCVACVFWRKHIQGLETIINVITSSLPQTETSQCLGFRSYLKTHPNN